MGSPRRQGNTEMLLDKALEGARQAGAEVPDRQERKSKRCWFQS